MSLENNKIIISGAVLPSVKNTPADIRTRITTISEVSNIPMPFIGMIFYVEDEQKHYTVKSLKDKELYTGLETDMVIDQYELLVNGGVDLSGYATEEFVNQAIAEIPAGPQGEKGEQGLPGAEGAQGPAGEQGPKGDTGAAGVDGKSAYEIAVEEGFEGEKDAWLASLKGEQGEVGPQGPAGEKGEQGLPGEQGPAGEKGEQGEVGPQGPKGDNGLSVTNVHINELNHLIVTLSDESELDAGELPAGSGGGTTDPSLAAELAETKQRLLDLTFGVDYEWKYELKQTGISGTLNFNPSNAPKFFEELHALEEGSPEEEEWWTKIFEEDIFRLYVIRVASDPVGFNKYKTLIPLEDNAVQELGEEMTGWSAVNGIANWNFDGSDENGFMLNTPATSPMVYVLMKVKK